MKIAITGTGMVGRTLAGFLSRAGHSVTVGTRNAIETMSRTDPNGKPGFKEWAVDFPNVPLKDYSEAAEGAEIIINATHGVKSIEALSTVGSANLDGKVLIDTANAFAYQEGAAPVLAVANTDSLGEQIQRQFPKARVVKTLNTVGAPFMVDPGRLPEGQPTIFVSGNDGDAKSQVIQILKDLFGWEDIVDLGDITTARGPEMFMSLWVRVWGAVKTPLFGFRLLK